MHRTRQAVRAQRTVHRAEGSDGEDSYVLTAAPKGVPHADGHWSDYENEYEGLLFEGDQEDDDGSQSDDERRRAQDPVFPKLVACVRYYASERAEATAAVDTAVSKRQRTQATVAAEEQSGKRRKKSVTTDEQPKTEPKTAEVIVKKKPRAFKKPAAKKPAAKKSFTVRFVKSCDARLPPDQIVECSPDEPPTLRWVCAAIFDFQGNRVRLKTGAEVTLRISVNGVSAAPLVCQRPFPGGLFYFQRLTYTASTSGPWLLELSARWTKTPNGSIAGTKHRVSVQMAQDRPKPPDVVKTRRRKQQHPIKSCSRDDLKRLADAPPDAFAPRRRWFLHEASLYAGKTLLIFDSSLLAHRIASFVDSIPPDNDGDQPEELEAAPAPASVATTPSATSPQQPEGKPDDGAPAPA